MDNTFFFCQTMFDTVQLLVLCLSIYQTVFQIMQPFKPPFLTADKLIGWDEIDGEDDDGRQADRREAGGSEDTTREDTSREDTTREDTAREDTAREAGRRKDSEGGRLGEDTAREDLQAEVGPNKDDESDDGGDLYSQVSFYFLLILHSV